MKVHKNIQILSQEERKSCKKEIKVKDFERTEGTYSSKGNGSANKEIGKKFQEMVGRIKIFHRKTRKKKEISDNRNVREITEQPTQNILENNKEYKKNNSQEIEDRRKYNNEYIMVLQILLHVIYFHQMLAEIRKIDIFLRNFTKKKLEKDCMVV